MATGLKWKLRKTLDSMSSLGPSAGAHLLKADSQEQASQVSAPARGNTLYALLDQVRALAEHTADSETLSVVPFIKAKGAQQSVKLAIYTKKCEETENLYLPVSTPILAIA
jgi:hypothetical protein